MARKPYTVENQRPRRTVSLYGRILAPKNFGGNAQCDLSEDELLRPGCTKLLQNGRLSLVRGTAPAALLAILSPAEEAAPVEPTPAPKAAAPAPAPVKVEPPSVMDVIDAERSADIEEMARTPEVVTPADVGDIGDPPAEPDLEDVSYVWGKTELVDLVSAQQKKILKSRGLPVGGNESTRVDRILQAQEDS